jgi:hypothetical protein
VPVTLVMLKQWRSHGYELMERTVELGFEAINPGTVYRTLRKMEKDGLCESEWDPPLRRAATSDVLHYRCWRGVPRFVGPIHGAVPADHG